ncbi:Calmodulin and related proteins (EF-Hand superfamily) [Handroanthus impetiginosus]|uniref:Calmodulin and related proteins (EF-Hand superfamily) n=1 Tax=Handroanthus impetiginosus TaxID=429701 RepID=A0A2G9I3D4_9LAMI|nr:Calmodulin and related proteins (EF-Hand superfamily) [Handroanthus impetiginosus]
MAIVVPFSWLFMLLLVINVVNARILNLHVSNHLILDGAHNSGNASPVLSTDTCEHMYGFFPCADNIGGYIFQIVVYQYLLIIGDKLVTKGSNTLFNIFGTGVYGASIFRILKVLPKMVMLIVSGVLKTKAGAQVQVSFGVGLYAGSTVFNLTLLWGMCVILGRKTLFPRTTSTNGSSVSNCAIAKKKLAQLKDTGTTIDKETCYTAGIMLLSLIPYIIVQLTDVAKSSLETRVVILIALIVSTVLLLSYFLYQIFYPWIQERSLKYTKYENLLTGFLHHVQRHAKGKLVDENGQPNIHVIRGLFHQTDQDADKSITFLELEKLIHEIQCGKVQVEKDYAMSEKLKVFDMNKDGRIEEHEFLEGCTKWINEAKQIAESGDSSGRIRNVFRPKKKRIGITEIEHLMARILKHAHNQALEKEHLVTNDGRLNEERIKALFKQFDKDNKNSLSWSELEDLIYSTVKSGHSQLNYQEMVEKLLSEFDTDGNNIIDEHEFVHGVTKWLIKAMDVTRCEDARRSIDEFDKIMWEEVDDLVYEVGEGDNWKLKLLTWDFNKSTLEVILGIAILTFVSGPLMTSIQQFSYAIGVPSFFISFVIVPVAMDARSAILAIFPASQKSSRTSSLTFSEIYGRVVMNNVMGLSVLLAIVYIKDLKWDYSAEVLTILIVCAIIGLLAYTQTTYPLWTCLLAFFLYPFSLVMYYVLQYVVDWGNHV